MALVVPEVDGAPPWQTNVERVRLKRLVRWSSVATVFAFFAAVFWLGVADPRLLTMKEIVPPDETLVLALLPALILGILSGVSWLGARRAVRRMAFTASSLFVELPVRDGAARIRLPWAELTAVKPLGKLHPFGGVLIETRSHSYRLEGLPPAWTDNIRGIWASYRAASPRA